MSTDQAEIIQIGHKIDYCRVWDGAAFTDNDALCNDHTNTTPFTLWADNDDFVYVGKDTTFAYLGFKVSVAGANYGTFTFEYAASGSYAITALQPISGKIHVAENVPTKFTAGSHFTVSGSTGNDGTYVVAAPGATWTGVVTQIPTTTIPLPSVIVDGTISIIWTILTPLHNSTSTFSTDGWLAWSIPGDWELRTVDSQSAYWVRATQTAAAPTPAQALHLLENVTLDPPILIDPDDIRERIHWDVNGVTRKHDMGFTGPAKLLIECTQLALSMADISLVWYWWDLRRKVYIKDLAQSTPLDFTADSYFRAWTGRIDKMPPRAMSPEKMDPEDYNLEFKIESVTTLTSTLGLTS